LTVPRLTVRFDERRIDSLFRGLDTDVEPGAAVGIAVGGEPVYRKGFGLANLELPVKISPSMRLRIGSTTKHFAALTYLLLCEQGDADLDAPIRRVLPELHPITDSITARHLLTHTSGLRDSHDIAWQFSGTGHATSCEDMLSFYSTIDDVNAPPDVTWSYNNGGYLLVTMAIERITGRRFEELLRGWIFERVGMHDTMLRRWDTDFVPNSAALHMTAALNGYERCYLGNALTGEGGVVSTADDMLRWLAHMDKPLVGSQESWRTLRTAHTLKNGVSTGYGCGLITSQYRGVEVLSHPGGVMGGNAQMLKVPAAGLDVVILVNRQDVLGMTLANQVLDACLSDLAPVPEHAGGAPFINGAFISPTTGRTIQLQSKDQRQIVSVDGDDMPFVPGVDGILRPDPLWGFVQQRLRLEGPRTAPSLIFDDCGNIDRLSTLDVYHGADASPIAGVYSSLATGTRVQIIAAQDGPQMKTFGRFGSSIYRLESLSKRVWRARSCTSMPWGGVLVFDKGTTDFKWSTSRTRSLPFGRES
jgi:D-aminopeptidase